MAAHTHYALHFHSYGTPQSQEPPLLALHGFTGCGSDFETLASLPPLNKYNWCAPDLLGHGNSPAPEDATAYTQAALIEQAASLIQQPTTLIGYSMGGRLAIGVALAHPEKVHKLILISASPGIRDEHARTIRKAEEAKLADYILKKGIPAFVDYWYKQPLIATQQSAPGYEARLSQRLKNSPVGLANSLRNFGQGSMQPLWNHLKGISCPTLLITGEQDIQYTQIAQAIGKEIPHAQHQIVLECGHAPHLENPAGLAKILIHLR